MEPVVYWQCKLSHSGITGYQVYENINRKVSLLSLRNLDKENKQAPGRKLNKAQSRRVQRMCQKLAYYSATRKFTSGKSGKYRFKVAFLTLTAPASASMEQRLNAFNNFLNYLRRTANCVYVWKKELGEHGNNLHFHIMINNFVPYYIIDWKWKRLLIAEGVIWPVNEKGEHTKSHYRIELPRTAKHVARYVAKYLSKAELIPKTLGYVAGHSDVLTNCKEIHFIPDPEQEAEIKKIQETHYTIYDDHYTHICCNILKLKDKFPRIYAVFEEMYIEFMSKITLDQKFDYIN